MNKFDLDVEEKNNIKIIHIDGELSFNTMTDIENRFMEEMQSKPEIIAINLKGVKLIDSMGISHLVKLSKYCISHDIELIFYNLSPQIDNLFKVAKLNSFFKLFSEKDFIENYLQD